MPSHGGDDHRSPGGEQGSITIATLAHREPDGPTSRRAAGTAISTAAQIGAGSIDVAA